MTESVRDAAWDAAIDRYGSIEGDAPSFNVRLLEALRPRWEKTIRPDTSMFRLLFTRPNTTGYEAQERVEVHFEAGERVRIALVRQVPRRGESHPVGPVTVAGDYTNPENAFSAVEAMLMQLAD